MEWNDSYEKAKRAVEWIAHPRSRGFAAAGLLHAERVHREQSLGSAWKNHVWRLPDGSIAEG